jgi:putative NIF3 family GTP cyclohydrolase 1 type 2
MAAHPYEEVAYDLYKLENEFALSGAGMIGELPDKIPEKEFLQQVKNVLGIPIIRHSVLPGKNIKKVAVCGGSGSFLLNAAISSGADIFLTGDIKYHQFFDADGKIILADVGHYESEQFTIELIADYLKEIFPTFALLISERSTNSVNYF